MTCATGSSFADGTSSKQLICQAKWIINVNPIGAWQESNDWEEKREHKCLRMLSIAVVN